MGTGFTWDTQDRQADIEAAERTWREAHRMLTNPAYDLVVLDELTYMLSFDYLDEASVLEAIRQRPDQQSVVVTGRGGGTALQELADTVSEVKEIKHAFRAGIKARKAWTSRCQRSPTLPKTQALCCLQSDQCFFSRGLGHRTLH